MTKPSGSASMRDTRALVPTSSGLPAAPESVRRTTSPGSSVERSRTEMPVELMSRPGTGRPSTRTTCGTRFAARGDRHEGRARDGELKKKPAFVHYLGTTASDQSVVVGESHQFGATVDLDLLVDVVQMDLHGPIGDKQLRARFPCS